MEVELHNKIELYFNKKQYIFYNTMYENVFDAIALKKAYNQFLAVGTGSPNNNQKTQKLSNFVKKYMLNTEFVQNNAENDSVFIKKSLVISDSTFDNNYIAEIGLCEDKNDNPDIYNYITLISDELPLGIKKEKDEDIVIYLYIYLNIVAKNKAVLCGGKNPLISYLLGEGFSGDIYAGKGKNLSENILFERAFFEDSSRVKTTITNTKEDGFRLSFSANLPAGETDEILFVQGENVVARKNILKQKTLITESQKFTSTNSQIVLPDDICEIKKIIDCLDETEKNDYKINKFSNSFAEKISLQFSGFCDSQSPRFVSKDGQYLFFVKNDDVYGYKNENGKLLNLVTSKIRIWHIKKIISSHDFVFVFTDFAPYLYIYKVDEKNVLQPVQNDLNFFEKYEDIEGYKFIDAVLSNSGKLILAIIFADGKGASLYFDYNSETLAFAIKSYQISNYNFSYIVALDGNIYSDARVMFLQGGDTSYNCRLVTHFADGTMRDVATVLAYDLTHNTKKIDVFGRAVVVEKTGNLGVNIYYYPDTVQMDTEQFPAPDVNWFSRDLYSVIQKRSDGSFVALNLTNIENVTLFQNSLSSFVDVSKIVGIEFLKDMILVFLDDENEKVVGITLYNNKTILENFDDEREYQITYTKFDKLGKNNEGIKAELRLNLSLWF